MLKSTLPNLYWQLYDWYLMPTGAYFGAKKACEPLHLLYNYGDNSIYIVNDLMEKIDNLKARVRIFDSASKQRLDQTVSVTAEADSSNLIFKLPAIDDLTTAYFLDLRLLNEKDEEIDNNFYWLSTKDDVLDYDAVLGDFTFHTPSKDFADLTQLNGLPAAQLEVQETQQKTEDGLFFSLTLRNKSDHISFLTELHLVNTRNGETVLPVLWGDNYISLLPGESRNITAKIEAQYLPEEGVRLKLNKFN